MVGREGGLSDQQQRYFEMVVSMHNEAKQKLMAWNANGVN